MMIKLLASTAPTMLLALVLVTPQIAAQDTPCDPATDNYCAKVRVFDGVSNCSGTPLREVSLAVNPASMGPGDEYVFCAASETPLADGTREAAAVAQVCAAEACDAGAALLTESEPTGMCSEVALPMDNDLRVLVDYDCRKAGRCTPGEDYCAVVATVGATCEDTGEAKRDSIGLVPDGECHPMGLGLFGMLSCSDEDDTATLRQQCGPGCEACATVLENVTIGECNVVGTGTATRALTISSCAAKQTTTTAPTSAPVAAPPPPDTPPAVDTPPDDPAETPSAAPGLPSSALLASGLALAGLAQLV